MADMRNSEQENQRTEESSNVDDRPQHEICVASFLPSVMAGFPSITCSYNLVNGMYACENNNTLNGVLKDSSYLTGPHSIQRSAR